MKIAEPTGRVVRFFGVECPDPIFIVGTGRCGSSLLARILRSHPQVVSFPNEGNELWHPSFYPHASAVLEHAPIEVNPKEFTEASVACWPAGQREKIRRTLLGFHWMIGRGKIFFVKSAMISFLMPELVELFPKARFIHIYRYGPSVVRSAVKRNTTKASYWQLTQIEWYDHWANYWNDCIVEIDRASEALGLKEAGDFIEFSYEALCENPGHILATVARFLRVDREGFTFDTSLIDNRNHKVAAFGDAAWLDRMHSDSEAYPAMWTKGYVS